MTELRMPLQWRELTPKEEELLKKAKELCELCARKEYPERKIDGGYMHQGQRACKAAELHAQLDAL